MYEKSLVNNIPVITHTRDNTTRFMLFIGVRAGNEHETDQNAGIAHLTEHMLFTDSENVLSKELIQECEWHGIDANAGTSNSHVYIQCSGPVEQLEKALSIGKRLIEGSTYTDKQFLREQAIVLEELRSYRNMPSEYIAYWETEPRIAEGTPAARNLFGTEKSLQAMTLQDIHEWKHKHYVPENIFITVCSSKGHGETCAHVERYFSSEKPHVAKHDVGEANPLFGKTTCTRKGIDQAYVQVSYRTPSFADEAYPCTLLLNYILDGGMSTRVFQELREKRGLGYHTGFRYVKESGYATFFIDGTQVDKVDDCEQAIQHIIQQLTTISEEEFNGVKTLLDSHIRERFEDDERLAYNALLCHVFDSSFDYKTLQKKINELTIQDVQQLAKKIFSQQNVTVVMVPEEK